MVYRTASLLAALLAIGIFAAGNLASARGPGGRGGFGGGPNVAGNQGQGGGQMQGGGQGQGGQDQGQGGQGQGGQCQNGQGQSGQGQSQGQGGQGSGGSSQSSQSQNSNSSNNRPTIGSISTISNSSLTISLKNGSSQTFAISSTSKVTRFGQKIAIASLNVGDMVGVRSDSTGNATLIFKLPNRGQHGGGQNQAKQGNNNS